MKKINKEVFKNLRILYVEDDLSTQEEISYFLKKYVGTLYVASNGEEGLKLFKKHNPDMVITDIQMPKMNGLIMSKNILEINPHVPIAVTTAFNDSEYILAAIKLGIDKYILKPLDMLEILVIIQKCMHLNIYKEKEVQYENYIQFLLDVNPRFMFIAHSNQIEYVNKDFLNVLGHKNISSLNKDMKNGNKLFSLVDVETGLSWLDYVVKNPNKKHLISSHSSEISKEFYIVYKYFEEMKKSVFIFYDTNEEKLKQIKEISSNIINKNFASEKDLFLCLQDICNPTIKLS